MDNLLIYIYFCDSSYEDIKLCILVKRRINTTLPPVDYSLHPAAVVRRCGGWRNGCTDVSLQEWLPSGHLNQGDWVAKQEADKNQPQINKLLGKDDVLAAAHR